MSAVRETSIGFCSRQGGTVFRVDLTLLSSDNKAGVDLQGTTLAETPRPLVSSPRFVAGSFYKAHTISAKDRTSLLEMGTKLC